MIFPVPDLTTLSPLSELTWWVVTSSHNKLKYRDIFIPPVWNIPEKMSWTLYRLQAIRRGKNPANIPSLTSPWFDLIICVYKKVPGRRGSVFCCWSDSVGSEECEVGS